MKLYSHKQVANEWHRMFAILPRVVHTLSTDGEKRVVQTKIYCLCFVERRYSVVKGVFAGVEYRAIQRHEHYDCRAHCGKPGCTAPLSSLTIAKLRPHETNKVPPKPKREARRSEFIVSDPSTLSLSDLVNSTKEV